MSSFKKTLFICIFFFSCSNYKSDIKVTESTINKLSIISDGIPSIYSTSPIYILLINKRIAVTTRLNMFIVFNKNYKHIYVSFKDFLRDAILQKISFTLTEVKVNPYVDSFSINKKVENNYKSIDFIEFKKTYCHISSNTLCLDRKKTNPNELPSVLYFLFINNYQIRNDDVVGTICFTDW